MTVKAKTSLKGSYLKVSTFHQRVNSRKHFLNRFKVFYHFSKNYRATVPSCVILFPPISVRHVIRRGALSHDRASPVAPVR